MSSRTGMEIAVQLSAVDKFTTVLNSAVNSGVAKLQTMQRAANQMADKYGQMGRQAAYVGGAAAASLYKPITAYAELQESQLAMHAAMMKDGGILDANTGKMDKYAVMLGNKLPGTTADMNDLFTVLMQYGVGAENILNGTGEAAAYLGANLKIPYTEAARLAAQMKNVMSVPDKDMMSFLDLISRAKNVGVDGEQLKDAFATTQGALKSLGIQGYEASKPLTALFATLIRGGNTGRTVGTNIARILNEVYNPEKMAKFNAVAAKYNLSFDFKDPTTGKFKGIENFIGQLSKMQGMNPDIIAEILQPFSGGEGKDDQFLKTLAAMGKDGYNDIVSRISHQGTLQAKINLQLQGLGLRWEAATGTFTNAMANWGSKMEFIIGPLVGWVERLSTALYNFADNHPRIAGFMGFTIGSFAALMLGAAGLFFTIAGGARAFAFMSSGASLAMKGIKGLSSAMDTARLMMMYMKSDGVVTGLMNMAKGSRIAAAATWIFNSALWSNPVVLITMAVIAAVAAVALLVWKWKEITGWFHKSAPAIKLMLVPLILSIWPIIALAKAINYLIHNTAFTEWLSNAWKTLNTFLSKIWNIGKMFFDAGKNIAHMIAKGIWAAINKPAEAVLGVVRKMRAYLPFSPAKEGPFKDLHRIKIVETIADSIKPNALVARMSNVSLSAVNALKPKSFGSSSGSGSGGGNAGGISIVYSPTITIGGDMGGGIPTMLNDVLHNHKDEVYRMIERFYENKKRLIY
jgi:TP901 family phage tail tape measure protein